MAKNQYSFEKRKREIEKKRKNEEKRQRKADRSGPSPEGTPEAPAAQTGTEATTDPAETQPAPQE